MYMRNNTDKGWDMYSIALPAGTGIFITYLEELISIPIPVDCPDPGNYSS